MWERLHSLNNGPLNQKIGNYIFGLGGSIGIARSEDGGTTFPLPLTAYAVLPPKEVLTIGLLHPGPGFVLIVSEVSDTAYLQGPLGGTQLNQFIDVAQHLKAVQWSDGQLVPALNGADIGTVEDGGANGIPYAAAAPNGTLYVTWSDGTKGIFVARSIDGGVTWTGGDHPAIVPAGRAFQPAIAARCDGSVGIFYYQYAAGSNSIVTPYIAVSSNGLTNWTATPIAQPFDFNKLSGGSNDGVFKGPGAYQDIVALPDGFGISVTLGNQLNIPAGQEQIFYIKARVRR